MNVNFFDINIIDTVDNNTALSLEKTAFGAPELVYNGVEDKFQNICTSELRFNFLVNDNSEGKFFDLTTAEEGRYKVELIDSSVPSFPKVVWCGFLLPEQFSEPYEYSGFFIDLVATDYVALLKTKDFVPQTSGKLSVLNVISKCLKDTGLTLDVYFSESVQNKGFAIDYLDLEVDTSSYVEDGGKVLSSYDVLDKCLKSIGCKLFLYNGAWYVVGLSKFKESTIVFKKYTNNIFSLLYDSQVVYSRDIVKKPFKKSPIIDLLPPLKKVITEWDAKNSKNLVPEDVVTHMPVNYSSDNNDRTIKYWTSTGAKITTLNVWYFILNLSGITINVNQYYNGFIATPANPEDGVVGGPYVLLSNVGNSTTLSDLDTNFMYLQDAFFVKGSADLERYASLELSFFALVDSATTEEELNTYVSLKGDIASVVDNGSGNARISSTDHGLQDGEVVEIDSIPAYNGFAEVTRINSNTFDIDKSYTVNAVGKWKIKPFKKNFHYALTRKDHANEAIADEEIILSNFNDANVPDGLYDFEISVSKGRVVGSVKIDKILLLNDGFYNIRVHPIVTNAKLTGALIVDKLNLTLNEEDTITYTQTRNINRTQEQSVSLHHSSSRMALSNRRFSFSYLLQLAIENETLVPGQLIVTPVSYQAKNVNSNGVLWYTLIEVVLSDADYARLQSGYTLYVVKSGETALQEVLATTYVLKDDGVKKLSQFQLPGAAGVFVEATDTIYLKLGNTSVVLNYANYWLDKFKRYDVEESRPFYECINSMYHDLLHENNFRVIGTTMALVGPLDIVPFSYRGQRNFYPTKLALKLNEGVTDITMVEMKNENVTDYD